MRADLDEKTAEALERHLATLTQPTEMQPDQFEKLKQEARRVGKLTVTIQGADGEQIVGTSEDALASNLPDKINWITFDSAASLRAYNVTPLNRFTLRIDFTEPPGFDSYNPWDQPTPNNSQLEVVGSDHTWATAVYESTLSFLRRRGRNRGWLHSQKTFNALNWLFWASRQRCGSSTGSIPRLASFHACTALFVVLYTFTYSCWSCLCFGESFGVSGGCSL